MKTILTTLISFLLLTSAFGQDVSTTTDKEIADELHQLFKDAESDFSPIRGTVASRDDNKIIYQTSKKYFQSAGFTNTLTFHSEARLDEFLLMGSGSSAEQVFKVAKDEFESLIGNGIVDDNSSGEYFVGGERIAQLLNQGGKFYIWLYASRKGWKEVNAKSVSYDIWLDDNKSDFLAFSTDMDKAKYEKMNNHDKCKHNAWAVFYYLDNRQEPCNEALKEKGADPKLYLWRGESYKNSDYEYAEADKPKAEADFLRYTKFVPNDADGLYELGRIQFELNPTPSRLADSLKNLTKAIQIGKQDKMFKARAKVYKALGKMAEACQDLKTVDPKAVCEESSTQPATNNQSDYEKQLNLCASQVKAGEYAKVIDTCTEAINLKKDGSEAYFYRGIGYMKTPDKPKSGLAALVSHGGENNYSAEKDFTKCAKLSPKESYCFLFLGMVQISTSELKDMDIPIKSLSEAIRLKTDNPNVYYLRAEANRKYNNIEEFLKDEGKGEDRHRESAIADYTKYISLLKESEALSGYLGRGQTFFSMKKYDLAIADMSKIIENQIENEVAYSVRGRSYLETNKYAQAVEDLTKAIEIHESSKNDRFVDLFRIEVYQARSDAYKALGKKVEACRDEKALDKNAVCDK